MQLGNVADCCGDLGIDRIAIGRLVGKADAQMAGIAADLLGKRPLRRRRDVEARRLRTMDRIHHDRAVADADAQHMADGEAAPALTAIGTARVAGARRLHAEYAGGGGGDPDRAAAVAGMRNGQDARGDSSPRAAGRATGGMIEIPGIAGRAEQARFRRRHQPEFRARALAEDRKTRIEETLGQRTVVIGDEVLQQTGARRGAGALEQIEILQQERHAGEGAVRQPLGDLALGVVVMLDDDCVDLRIDGGRARNRLVEQLPCRDVLVADELGETDRVVVAEFLESHVRAPHRRADLGDRPRRKREGLKAQPRTS
ncbi:hypothetical protein ACVWY2_001292 [Bradyrhizobium sp. JR6.1]